MNKVILFALGFHFYGIPSVIQHIHELYNYVYERYMCFLHDNFFSSSHVYHAQSKTLDVFQVYTCSHSLVNLLRRSNRVVDPNQPAPTRPTANRHSRAGGNLAVASEPFPVLRYSGVARGRRRDDEE